MRKAAKVGDDAFCSSDGHGKKCCSHAVQGPAVQGSPDVLINTMQALRIGDPGIHSACCGSNTWKAAEGASTVLINGLRAVRIGDKSSHCGGSGKLIEGSPNVFIDDKSEVLPDPLYDEQYRILDEDGEPMANVPYYIKDELGRVYKGITEEDGLCPRVFTDNEEELEVYLGVAAMEKWGLE
jgi:uncharacterized Zn-binding protein involved in type VI secretion